MQEKRGHNKLKETPPKSVAARFVEQLNDPLIFVLFVAAAISMLMREFGDTTIILTVILMNATIGVIQEGKADRALAALKDLSAPKAFIRPADTPPDHEIWNEIPQPPQTAQNPIYLYECIFLSNHNLPLHELSL